MEYGLRWYTDTGVEEIHLKPLVQKIIDKHDEELVRDPNAAIELPIEIYFIKDVRDAKGKVIADVEVFMNQKRVDAIRDYLEARAEENVEYVKNSDEMRQELSSPNYCM